MTVSLTEKKPAVADWTRKRISQRILLGEYAVGRPSFEAITAEANFLLMPPGLESAPPIADMDAAGVDVASITSYPTGGPLPKLKRIGGCVRYVTNQYRHYFVRIDGTFSDYLAAFAGKTRSTLLRKVKKFQQLTPDETHFRVYRRPEEMDEFVTMARQVAERTFQEHLFGYGLPDTPEFRRSIVERAREGAVEGYVLFSGEKPVAYIHGPISDGRIILYDHVGYDPEFSRWSPGTVLQYMVVEHLFNEGRLEVYDLCTGEGEHKRIFANDHRYCADIYYFRPKPRYLLIFLTHLSFQKLSRLIVWTLERFQIKSHLKKFLRRRG